MQNRQYFQEIVRGRYGRKISYANVEKITPDNVLKVLGDHVGDFHMNKVAVRYLDRYVKGDQPIFYRVKSVRDDVCNKVVENHAYEVVQFNVAQTYGEPLQYISMSDSDAINKSVDELNRIMRSAFKYQRNITQGEWKSKCGTSFLAVQRTGNGNKPFRITVPTPMNTFVVYSSITEEPLMSVQELKDEQDEQYYHIFTASHEFKVKSGKLIYSGLHAFGGIPIVEVPNNADRLSDVEIVITMLDAINTMQSNRMDGIEQFIQAWVKFVNCEVDETQFAKMKEMGALVVKSNNGAGNKADVDIMSQSLDQQQSQVAKDDLWDNALSILAIPSKQGNTGGDTQGAVQLRNGWDFAKSRAKLKDAYVVEAETRLVEVILNILRIDGKGLNLNISDFEVNIPHSPQDNMTVKANVLSILLSSGIHPLVAIKVCGLWNDPENVYMLSKPYLDVLHKTIDDEIAQLPDGEEQVQKAQQIVDEVNAKNNPTTSLKERIENALNANIG